MLTQQKRSISFLLIGICLLGPILTAVAQDVVTNPPLLAPPDGASPSGSYSLSNIEAVNTIYGNVTLRFPLGALPSGPGGFSVGVNLTYNSGIDDAFSQALTTTLTDMPYQPSSHGGGWTYGYKYVLWAQPRATAASEILNTITNSDACNYFTSAELTNWYLNFLRTPDGANHALYLVGASGPLPSQDTTYGYSSFDFSGWANPAVDCGHTGFYSGTLAFATGDGSFIRVETNTVTETWTAFLPDGTTVSGPIQTAPGTSGLYPYGTASPSMTITDRNGNSVTDTPLCQPGQACTDQLTDAQGRVVSIAYSGTGATWSDTVTSQGIHGPLMATVNWAAGAAPNPAINFVCESHSTAPFAVTSPLCTLQSYPPQVTSMELPPATSGGPATNFTFAYTPQTTPQIPQGAETNWGEVHTMTECIGTSPSNCQQRWNVYYGYTFDALPSTSRPPGQTVNPISIKQLNYSDTLAGTVTPLTETTQYSIQTFASPFALTTAGPVPTPNTITNPDGTTTTIYLTLPCSFLTAARENCSPLVYKVSDSDGSTTEQYWVANAGNAIFNAYPQLTVKDSRRYLAYQSNPIWCGILTVTPRPKRSTIGYPPTQSRDPMASSVAAASCPSNCRSVVESTTDDSNASPYTTLGQGPVDLRAPHAVSLNGLLPTMYTYGKSTEQQQMLRRLSNPIPSKGI